MVLIFAPISVKAMAWGGVGSAVFAFAVNSYPNRTLIGYGVREQLRDVVPNWLLSVAMFMLVQSVSLLNLPVLPELMIMVIVGVVSYVAMSVLFRVESFSYIWNMVQPVLRDRFGKKQ